jgi:hypothetical protein
LCPHRLNTFSHTLTLSMSHYTLLHSRP